MARLDTVELFIEDEDGSYAVEATVYAVEKGEPFTDHVKKTSPTFSISGYILSEDWETEKNKLIKIMESGKIINYVGKMTATSVIILDVKEKHNWEVANGMGLSISLRRVRITSTPWQKMPPKQKPAQKPPTNGGNKKPVPAKPNTSEATSANKEQYHVTKKGDTFWGLSGKYGSSISELRLWNSYEDKKIPIGVKILVKKGG